MTTAEEKLEKIREIACEKEPVRETQPLQPGDTEKAKAAGKIRGDPFVEI